MEFKQLLSFANVVKYGSFTKAAEELYTSQPTISAHINQLEEELKFRLIMRTTKRIEVTPKGEELYKFATKVLSLKEDLTNRWELEKLEHIIRLGTSSIPSTYILPEILPAFIKACDNERQNNSINNSKINIKQKANKIGANTINKGKEYKTNIQFNIHENSSENIISDISDGILEVGLVGIKTKAENIKFTPFFKDEIVLITPYSDTFLEYKEQNTSIKEMLQNEPIILRESPSNNKKFMNNYLNQLKLKETDLKITARLNDLESIKVLVVGGLGISIISKKAAENLEKEKKVLTFAIPNQSKVRTLYIAYRKDFILKAPTKAFIKFVSNFYVN
ncbi:MAG: LysR family transcriptional regulator [Lachnospiraceae bacterium]|jgi:DNA-binding transcriptional LysR family regulator|nr:LysR family transcriptional regulator [Lachnospiraceae bacterium]